MPMTISQSPVEELIRCTGTLSFAIGGLTQLLFLVLDEPADHLPPKRLRKLRRKALLVRLGARGEPGLRVVDDEPEPEDWRDNDERTSVMR